MGMVSETVLFLNGRRTETPVRHRLESLCLEYNLTLRDCPMLDSVESIQSLGLDETDCAFTIIGPQCDNPVQIAKQLHHVRPECMIVFLTNELDSEWLPQLQSPISGLGRNWEIIPLDSPAMYQRLVSVIMRTVKKRRFRTTLSHVSNQLRLGEKHRVSELQRHSVSLRFLTHIVDHAHDGIIATTNDGAIVKWNKASEKLFQLPADDAFGRSIFDVLSGSNPARVEGMYQMLLSANTGFSEHELELILPGQKKRTMNIMLSVIRDDDGQSVGVTAFLRDITERKITEKVLSELRLDLERMSYEDGLTGIANRRRFDTAYEQEWRRLRRSQSPLSLILFDIDCFKEYNDCYGHQAGDDCLKRVAQSLRASVRRSSDLVARYGGEEFVVLLPETDEDDAFHLACACCDAVSQQAIPHQKSAVATHVTLSGGVLSVIPGREHSPSDALCSVDKLLYHAKKQGRNQVQRHSFKSSVKDSD